MSWTTGFRERCQLFEATVDVREAVSVGRARGVLLKRKIAKKRQIEIVK